MPIFVSWAISKEWNFIWSSLTSCCRTKWNFLMIIYAVFHLFKYEVVDKVKGVDDQTWASLYVLTLKTLCRKHVRTQLFSDITHIWQILMKVHKWVTLWNTHVKTVTVGKLANHTRFEVFTLLLLRIQVILDVMLCFLYNGSQHLKESWCLYL